MKVKVKGILTPKGPTWAGSTALHLSAIDVDLELEFVATDEAAPMRLIPREFDLSSQEGERPLVGPGGERCS